MRKSVRCWLRALPLAALAAAAPLLLIGGGARSVPASVWPECGVAAWTGTCVCAAGPHGDPVSLATFSRSHPTAAALDQARRQCAPPS